MVCMIINKEENVGARLLEIMNNNLTATVDDIGTDIELIDKYNKEPGLITWTSSTTGKAKGVVTSWDAVKFRIDSLLQYYKEKDYLKYFTTAYCGHPLNNSGCCISTVLLSAINGNEYVRTPEEASVMSNTSHRLKKFMLDNKKFPNLNLLINNGMKIDDDLKIQLEDYFEVPIVDMYGQSEIGAVAMDGELLNGYEAKVENDIFLIKSKGMAICYLHEKLKTKGDWLITNDRGRISNGKLIPSGRKELKGHH